MDYGLISNFENIPLTSNYTYIALALEEIKLRNFLMYLFLTRVEKPSEGVKYSVI